MTKGTRSIRDIGIVAMSMLAAAAAAGCDKVSSPVQPAAASVVAAKSLESHDSAPTDGTEAHESDLDAVRRATAHYQNAAAAAAAGYSLHDEPCVQSPAGAMGIHALNREVLAAPLDPERPGILLYLPQPGGHLRLVAVEYLQVVLVRDPVTSHVGPWTSSAPWPANYQVVNPTPHLFGQRFDGPMPGHSPGMPWHWDLHVWLWAHNPAGLFAQWNPSLSCAG